MTTRALIPVLAVSTLLALAACSSDPIHSDARAALGPETPGIPRGPYHRAGQPCLVCHGGQGPATMVLSVAGTVYQHDNSLVPFANAIVKVADSAGHTARTGTNCVGNFFFQPADFNPVFPIWVAISYGGQDLTMNTPIFRQGSCANCHRDPRGVSSAGHVYYKLSSSGFQFPPSGCP